MTPLDHARVRAEAAIFMRLGFDRNDIFIYSRDWNRTDVVIRPFLQDSIGQEPPFVN